MRAGAGVRRRRTATSHDGHGKSRCLFLVPGSWLCWWVVGVRKRTYDVHIRHTVEIERVNGIRMCFQLYIYISDASIPTFPDGVIFP